MLQPFANDANRRRLRRLMKKHKLNCREVAELLGYSHQHVRAWHSGQKRPSDIALAYLSVSLRS